MAIYTQTHTESHIYLYYMYWMWLTPLLFSLFLSFSRFRTLCCECVSYKLLMHGKWCFTVLCICHEPKIRYMIIFFHLEVRTHSPDAATAMEILIHNGHIAAYTNLHYIIYRIQNTDTIYINILFLLYRTLGWLR